MDDYFQHYPQQPLPIAPGIATLTLAAAFAAGIILARYVTISAVYLWAILFPIGFALWAHGEFSLHRRLQQNLPPRWARYSLWAGLLLIMLILGTWRFTQHQYAIPPNHVSRVVQDQPRLASIRGTIISQPVIYRDQSTFHYYNFLGQPCTVFQIQCEQGLMWTGWQNMTGILRVTIYSPRIELSIGDTLEFDGWLRPIYPAHNPGTYDPSQNAALERVAGVLTIQHSESARRLASNHSTWLQFQQYRTDLRQRCYHDILSRSQQLLGSEKGTRVASLLGALLLGQRQDIPSDLRDTFVRTGTIHFLAVSGLHVGLVAAFAWTLAWLVRLPTWARALIALIAVAAFVFIIPTRPPIMRAAIVTACFCIAAMGRIRLPILSVLGLAALINLLYRPQDLFMPGFQLSYVVVLGLVIIAPGIYKYSPRTLWHYIKGQYDIFPIQPPHLLMPVPVFIRRLLLVRFWQLIVISFVAWVIGSPLVVSHFHRLTPWGGLNSIILAPAMFLTLLVGYVTLLVLFLSGGAGSSLTIYCTYAIERLTHLFSQLPHSALALGQVSSYLTVTFYALIILLVLLASLGRRGLFRYAFILLLAFLFCYAFLTPALRRRLQPTPALHVLSVGHGCCVIAELGRQTLMYDIGSLSRYDLAESIVVPFLYSRGINRVDHLIISHADIDHYCGALDITRQYKVGQLYLPATFTSDTPSSAAAFLLKQLDAARVPISSLQAGDSVNIPTSNHIANDSNNNSKPAPPIVKVLWPQPQFTQTMSDNEQSIVLDINLHHRRILLCGDITERVQRILIAQGLVGPVDLLILPHHGSTRTLDRSFVHQLSPGHIIVSGSRMDAPECQALQKLLPPAPLYLTGRHGYINYQLTTDTVTTHLP